MQLPRDVRELARFAADAVNAYMRGQSIPAVALHYRYEPITAITTLRHLCLWYGRANVELVVPRLVFSMIDRVILPGSGK
jgi:hypothetical protein